MIERRMLKNLDLLLLLTVVLIMAISLVVIASATHANINEGADPYYYVKRQGLVICAGLVALVVYLALDYHTQVQYANYIYAANLGLLLAVLALAKDVKGAGRWIDLGFFRLQPSEFAKIFLIITLANYLANTAGEMEKLSDLFPLLLHVAVPMLLIMLQPDLGTALVLLAILMGMMFVAGIKIQHLFSLVLAGVAAFPFFWHFLKDYQRSASWFSRPQYRSNGFRLPRYPVYDCHWVGAPDRPGPFCRPSEPAQFSPGATYRFYFFCGR